MSLLGVIFTENINIKFRGKHTLQHEKAHKHCIPLNLVVPLALEAQEDPAQKELNYHNSIQHINCTSARVYDQLSIKVWFQ